jgi:hypothetical protein
MGCQKTKVSEVQVYDGQSVRDRRNAAPFEWPARVDRHPEIVGPRGDETVGVFRGQRVQRLSPRLVDLDGDKDVGSEPLDQGDEAARIIVGRLDVR